MSSLVAASVVWAPAPPAVPEEAHRELSNAHNLPQGLQAIRLRLGRCQERSTRGADISVRKGYRWILGGTPQATVAASPRKYATVSRRPSSSGTRGSHPSTALALVISGLRCFGSSSGSGSKDDFRLGAGHAPDVFGELQNRHLARIAQVHRIAFVGQHQPVEPVHQVAHVTEAARLRAGAEDRHGFVAQSLIEERRHHAAIVQLHARAVGIEDARDVGAHAVLAMVGHGDGLGEALALVVAGARTHRIHIAPIRLHLRMHQRVAVAFAGGGQQEARVLFAAPVPACCRVPSEPTSSVSMGCSR